MMMLIATIVFLILLAISALHLAWALGSTFPVADRIQLARTVVGFRNQHKMPGRSLTLLVTVATFIVGMWAYALAGAGPMSLSSWVTISGGIAISVVFIARGFAGYTRTWRMMAPEQPFARLDARYYSPLCLLLGLLFVVLTLGYIL